MPVRSTPTEELPIHFLREQGGRGFFEVAPAGDFVDHVRACQREHDEARRAGRDHHYTITGAYVVAIVDSGLLHDHPLLGGRIVGEVDFSGQSPEDVYGHGSAVALKWLTTAPPPMGLLNVKVVGDDGWTAEAKLVRGLAWLGDWAAAHPGIRVVANVSLGVYSRRWAGLRGCDGRCSVCAAAEALGAQDVTVVAAAGNEPRRTSCPATAGRVGRAANVIAVAATDTSDSGIGDIAAPSATSFATLEHAGGATSLFIGHLADEPNSAAADRAADVDAGEERRVRLSAARDIFSHAANFETAGDLARAAPLFSLVRELNDELFSPAASRKLAVTLIRNKRAAAAVPVMEALASEDADADVRAEAAANLAVLSEQAGDPTAAAAWMQRAVEDTADAGERLRRRVVGGDLWRKAGEPQRARAEWLAVLAQGDPQWSTTAAAYLGAQAVLEDDREEAERYFRIAIRSSVASTRADAWLRLARLQRRTGQPTAALVSYREVLATREQPYARAATVEMAETEREAAARPSDSP